VNKTKIEWADYTWNPLTGCQRRCAYCYAQRLAKGRLRMRYLSNPNVAPGCNPDDPFSPRFWPGRLHEPRKNNNSSKIFVCSMGELFDPSVPDEWIQAVLDEATFCWWHTFQFLTKQPQRAAQFTFPPNAWVGISVDKYSTNCWQRQVHMAGVKATVRFISYEPLLSLIPDIPYWADWAIIGAMTGPDAIKPKPQWVHQLIRAADGLGIPLFLKDNLGWPETRTEWPT